MPLAAAIALTVVPYWREIAQSRVSPEATVWVAACAAGVSLQGLSWRQDGTEARTVRECLDKDDLQWIDATHSVV